MLYPLSYEGGGVFVQVRPYFLGPARLCPSVSCPLRARSMREQRFSELLFAFVFATPSY